jgi:hypothetical protein
MFRKLACSYHHKNETVSLGDKKNSVLFVFPSHRIIISNLFAFCKPYLLHEWSAGNPACADYVSTLTVLILPLPHHMRGVW